MDLISTASPTLNETFADHPAYAWLIENVHNFGFILRYPKGEEGTTGYTYEPWHYRFVGVEAASKIYRKGLTLEEYLD
jgi:D-alanyl-D-alanine carboxypeptidase